MVPDTFIPTDVDSLALGDVRAIAARELGRRARISAAKTGVPRDEATRRKIGEALSGKPLSPEQRSRIASGMRRSWARRKAAATTNGQPATETA